jgi:hypothetical protein
MKEKVMSTNNVLTEQRYSQGLTYEAYLDQLGETRQRFEEHAAAFQLTPADTRSFKKLVEGLGGVKVLAIAEDWCPDVHRGLPIMSAIVRNSGMEMRVFPRDKNMDIMNLYLKQGKYMSIPVFAFFDSTMKPIGHWIERPEAASKFMEELAAELTAKKFDEKELRSEIRKRNQLMTDKWRKETVKELKAILSGI